MVSLCAVLSCLLLDKLLQTNHQFGFQHSNIPNQLIHECNPSFSSLKYLPSLCMADRHLDKHTHYTHIHTSDIRTDIQTYVTFLIYPILKSLIIETCRSLFKYGLYSLCSPYSPYTHRIHTVHKVHIVHTVLTVHTAYRHTDKHTQGV